MYDLTLHVPSRDLIGYEGTIFVLSFRGQKNVNVILFKEQVRPNRTDIISIKSTSLG